MSTSRELALCAIEFRKPERIPICLAFDTDPLNKPIVEQILKAYSTDIMIIPSHNPNFVPEQIGMTQWGYRWESKGETMGEVKDNPLRNWDVFDRWLEKAPDFSVPIRYNFARKMRLKYPDKFLIGGIGFMVMEAFNLRGLDNFLTDPYLERENLDRLLDFIYTQGIHAVDGFAEVGMDAVIAWEDWGLQDRAMMAPDMWYDVFYDRMKNFVDRIHAHGMKYVLHSCGHILGYLDFFVEMGVDVLQLDQQLCMGHDLEELSKYRGKICFFNPIDIQHSPQMNAAQIHKSAQYMRDKLSTEDGGFMYKAYAQPAAIRMPAEGIINEIHAFAACKG